ncbi:hypothetical protein OK349_02975 [Sphingomonas sp. BT-65]|uniref:hypothetical protein n=1 Tax=Sphingomonas sp. BT-65 TaxID=2989821 RepID=UPI0022357B5A|nr:hypothetical protein [Sphingomonas sp. BT-65]MCW4460655.1 hypothetical protein [Sphingomonas sp. BT-65]
MAYREKVQWVSLATSLVVWGLYFAQLAASLTAGRPAPADTLGGFIGAVILLVVIQVAAIIAIAIHRPSEAELPADPREREIEQSAGKGAYAVLSLAVVAIMLATPVLTMAAPAALGQPTGVVAAMLVGNALLAALVLASIVHSIWQIILYRRQA